MLFFDPGPASGSGPDDIWVTRRATVSDPWGLPVNLGPPVNSPADDEHSNISADGRTLYFTSNRPGGYGRDDLWQVSILGLGSDADPNNRTGSDGNSRKSGFRTDVPHEKH